MPQKEHIVLEKNLRPELNDTFLLNLSQIFNLSSPEYYNADQGLAKIEGLPRVKAARINMINVARSLGYHNLVVAKLSDERAHYLSKQLYLQSLNKDINNTRYRLAQKSHLPKSGFSLEQLGEIPLGIDDLIANYKNLDEIKDYIINQISRLKPAKIYSLFGILDSLYNNHPDDKSIAIVANPYGLFKTSFMLINPQHQQDEEAFEAVQLSLKIIDRLSRLPSHQNLKILGIHNFANASKRQAHDQFIIEENIELRIELKDQNNLWPCATELQYKKLRTYINDLRLAGKLISQIYLTDQKIGIIEHDVCAYKRENLESQLVNNKKLKLDPISAQQIIFDTALEIYEKVGPAGFEVAGNVVVDKTQVFIDMLLQWLNDYENNLKHPIFQFDQDSFIEKILLENKKLIAKTEIFCELFGLSSHLPYLDAIDEWYNLPVDSFSSSITKPTPSTLESIRMNYLINSIIATFKLQPEVHISHYYHKISRIISPDA